MAPKSLPEGLMLVRKIKLENDQLVPSEVCARVAKHLNQAKRSRLRVGTEMDYDVPDRWWHRFEDNEAWLVWLDELGKAIGAVPRTKRKDPQGRPTAESWKTAIKAKLYEEMQREDREYHVYTGHPSLHSVSPVSSPRSVLVSNVLLKECAAFFVQHLAPQE